MKNNNYYLFILFLTSISVVKSYSQESVTVSGGTATGTGGTASYSIGQTTFTSQISSGGNVTAGVQQAYEIVTLGNNDFAEINLVMSAYPNPTIDVLNLVVSDEKWSGMSYQLFDLNGKTLSKLQKMITSETSISMQELQRGIYFLTITNGLKTIKTFKIIKK
ncbi:MULTISPECIES: T9SS type A sorting domain-containing protein [unclassified Flavobacterium]|uniref:T9SS type A sorting domain-containing protein n=1 Tax=unclassified Flavobacterium TaxID=196869 RepID=UPI00131C2AC4|nr:MULTISPECIES: T9SS type A sorting domain-containing protein [unclassified Flavobacterium]